MARTEVTKRTNERGIIGIIICILIFVIGQLLLDKVASMEQAAATTTAYILVGSTFRFISVLGIVVILRLLYTAHKQKQRRARKRKNHKLHFLRSTPKSTEQKKE